MFTSSPIDSSLDIKLTLPAETTVEDIVPNCLTTDIFDGHLCNAIFECLSESLNVATASPQPSIHSWPW